MSEDQSEIVDEREFWIGRIRHDLVNPGATHSHYGIVEVWRRNDPMATGIGSHPCPWDLNPNMLMSPTEAKELSAFALSRAEHLLISAVQLRIAAEAEHVPASNHLENVVGSLMRCLREEIEKPENWADMQPWSKT